METGQHVLTLILAGGRGERLYPLTRDRAKPAVPFGGIYRIIDFTLSNAINSGLRRIYVMTQYKSLSLQRHIKEGWNILSRELNEFIELVPAQQRIGDDWYLGTGDSVFQNIHLLEDERPDLVLILAGDHIYKMDYRKFINSHLARSADLTISAFELPRRDANRFGVLTVDEDGRVVSFAEKPQDPAPLPDDPETSLVSMGIYVFSRDVLIRRLVEDAKKPDSEHDFGKNIIPSMIGRDAVYAYRFVDENRKETKYWRDIGTIDAYWEANMDLVNVDPILNIYDRQWPLRTYQSPLPPAKTVFSEGERMALVQDSLITGGCIVSGGRVRHSILSPWTRVNSYAEVSDSILMEGVQVGRHARVRRAVVDKDVIIPPGMVVGYDLESDRKRFTVSPGGIIVIPKGYRF